WDCIWRWKRSIFLTCNNQLDRRVLGDCALPHVQQRIQRWLDQRGGYPPLGHDTEYSRYVEECYPLPVDRQAFFKGLSCASEPHLGYQLLGLLPEAGKIKWLWTTNFDDLVDRGRPSDRRRPFLQVGMDCPNRIDVIPREGDDIVQV